MVTRRRSLVLVPLCLGLLGGCAVGPTHSISPADRQLLGSVRVDPEVAIPAPVYIFGSPVSHTLAAGGGIVGVIAKDVADRAGKTELGEFARANGFSLADIVKTEFIRAAAAKGSIKFSETESSPLASLTLHVSVYGFGQDNGWSSKVYPLLNVRATMKRLDGTVVWDKTEFVTPLNGQNKPGYTYEEYVGDARLVRQAFTRAAAIVASALAADLYK